MARVAYGRSQTRVNTTSYPDDNSSPVGTNEWNLDPEASGLLGFTKVGATLDGSGVLSTKDDSATFTNESGASQAKQSTLIEVECNGSSTTDAVVKIDITDTNINDVVYLFKGTDGDDVTVTSHSGSFSANGQIKSLDGNPITLNDTGKPVSLMRRGNYWFEFGGGGSASDLDTTNFAASTLVIESEGISSNDNDTTIPTSAAVKDYVDSTPVGDITSVVAGSGLTGGGTSADVTLNVIGGTGITANADDIAIDSTVTTLTGSQTLTNKTLTAPTLTTPALGTPASGDLQNCTAVPSSVLTGTIADARMPDLTGEVTTSAGAVATIIVNDIVDEANLKVDNTPTDDYVLTAKSGASGGLTWAAGGGGDEATPVLQASSYSAANQSPSTEGTHKVSIFTKTIDSNNQGLYVRVKKNGAYEDVQIG